MGGITEAKQYLLSPEEAVLQSEYVMTKGDSKERIDDSVRCLTCIYVCL